MKFKKGDRVIWEAPIGGKWHADSHWSGYVGRATPHNGTEGVVLRDQDCRFVLAKFGDREEGMFWERYLTVKGE